MKFDVKPYEVKMKKCVENLSGTLSTLRLGRASADCIAPIKFEYYGAPTPVIQMADVKAADARTLVIQPWDASTLKAIEKAILISDLGITPMNDGKVIRLNFPQLTEERRREVTKQIAKYAEEAKVSVRNVRREANDAI
ncbi:MAG: ribosome recycling factor, partial [Clostridia bacterium]|nr:ribosome recycling factor [Clostridia bacterium]